MYFGSLNLLFIRKTSYNIYEWRQMILSIIIIILLIMCLFAIKNTKNTGHTQEEFDKLERELIHQTVTINNLVNNLENKLSNQSVESSNQVTQLVNTLDTKLNNQSRMSMLQLKESITKIETQVDKQQTSSNNNINTVIERITKLDSAQKQMLNLSQSIISLEKVLNDKKTRGTFGEQQLHQIIASIYGERNDTLYQEQYKLSNGRIADLIVFAPDPLGAIVVDSKFPLENYLNMTDTNNDNEIINIATKNFKNDIKKHINDIRDKYIIENETATQAIMFIPAESIYNEIIAKFPDLVEYSQKSKVWISSPTNLVSILNMLQIVLKDIKRNENAQQIKNELRTLSVEFERFATRIEKLDKNICSLHSSSRDVTITKEKIVKRFNEIDHGDVE